MTYLYETVPVGSYWYQDTYGSVYKVVEKWPSFGNDIAASFTLLHVRTGERYVRNYREMCGAGLVQIEPEEVPLKLLGAA
jgi:hypothetical protein